MTERDDGGPAFPWLDWESSRGEFLQKGMSLRDYFAAKAMEAILANSQIVVNDKTSISSMAYQMADSMLAARKA